MHPSKVNEVRRKISLLTLAEVDMRQVANAARALNDDDRLPFRRMIETGLVVTYCRPFSGAPKDGVPPQKTVVDMFAPTADFAWLHAQLWEVRNKLFGHTDDDYKHRRMAVDVFGSHRYSEQYQHLDPERLVAIAALAEALAEQFREAKEELQQSLIDAGVPPLTC